MDTPLYERAFKPTFTTEDMVSFLEFILNNPQTNTEHAFNAFQNNDLERLVLQKEEAEPPYDGPEERVVKEMEIPVINIDPEYDDESYESPGFEDYNIDNDPNDRAHMLFG